MSEPEKKINADDGFCISRAELREILKADTVGEALDKHYGAAAVPETTHWVETAGDPSAAPVFPVDAAGIGATGDPVKAVHPRDFRAETPTGEAIAKSLHANSTTVIMTVGELARRLGMSVGVLEGKLGRERPAETPDAGGRTVYQIDCGSEATGDRELFHVEGPPGLDLAALETEFDSRFPPWVGTRTSSWPSAEYLKNNEARREAFSHANGGRFAKQFVAWLCENHGCTTDVKGLVLYDTKND
jgi:hypothetical protein